MTRWISLLVVMLGVPAEAALRLEADLSDRELRVLHEDSILETYPISVGKEEKPTPTGSFLIRKMIWNPHWVPPNEKWARGKSAKPPGHPENPMKIVKIFFREPDYYIHGTDEVDSLGQARSHGCIRMAPEDVMRLGRTLMEYGGNPQPEPWYRRILRRRTAKAILLQNRIPLKVEE